MMESLIVNSRHCRAAGMCLTPGVRDFFARHNLDYRDFIRNGIDANKLIEATQSDAMALQVVSVARKEQEANNGQ
jgi:hypothetical protein